MAPDDRPAPDLAARIDHHAHWLPEGVLEALSRRSEPPRAWRERGAWVFQAAHRPRPLPPAAHDLSARARRLAALGLDTQVLSWSPLWNLDALPPDTAAAVARAFNDATGAASRGRPFRGLAVVPPGPSSLAVEELCRAAALGLEGFVLPACRLGDPAQADAVAPLFEVARASALRVFVHPGRLPDAAATTGASPWHRHLGLEPQHEVGRAMLTLCQDGWLDAFPGVPVQFANGGGSLPSALERLSRMNEDDVASAARRARLLERITVDTASLGPVGIATARALLGPAAVVFGTDDPIFDATRARDDWRRSWTVAGGSIESCP